MSKIRKIKVLVVDDSLLFREALARGLSKDPGIEVVATASDAYMARDKIIEFEPDVVTLDVEMPRMNGIEFLRRLIPQYPIPVIVVSAINDSVFEALNAGAVDFVVKPDAGSNQGVETLVSELAVKIKIASTVKLGNLRVKPGISKSVNKAAAGTDYRMVAIGASTGGTEAIYSILRTFSKDMPGIVIVQHMPPVFTRMYAERLNNSCLMEIKEAQDGDKIEPGRVLIAPGDYQMRVNRGGTNYYVECFKGEKVNGHCPSVDVLFESVANKVGDKAIGVILTGMGYDGAKGMLSMRRKGARTIGQDEVSCVVYGMPKVAYEMGAVEKQVPLDKISSAMMSILNSR